MRRLLVSLGAFALVSGFVHTPNASAQQSINLYVGGFTPRAVDGRTNGDVLTNNLDFLAFRIKDFNGWTFGGEWLFGFANYFEGGLGVGFYQRTVPSVYLDLVNPDGSEIEQNLKLRVVPFTATIRFLPLGLHEGFQPYVGGGVGVLAWRYSETGQFVDPSDGTVFRGNFVGSGSATGPLVLGGVRVSGDQLGVGGEIRYQSARGTLPSDLGFAGPRIDLSGLSYLFTLNIKF